MNTMKFRRSMVLFKTDLNVFFGISMIYLQKTFKHPLLPLKMETDSHNHMCIFTHFHDFLAFLRTFAKFANFYKISHTFANFLNYFQLTYSTFSTISILSHFQKKTLPYSHLLASPHNFQYMVHNPILCPLLAQFLNLKHTSLRSRAFCHSPQN